MLISINSNKNYNVVLDARVEWTLPMMFSLRQIFLMLTLRTVRKPKATKG